MIINFANRVAEDVFNGLNTRYARQSPVELHNKAQRLLDQLNSVTKLDTLHVPPSNRLEKLKGDLNNYWSLRINRQWRITFQWENSNVYEVSIVDYH